MKKRIKKTISLIYFVFWFILLFEQKANAYIDPSVVTYVIQAVAGIAIAIGAAVGIYWRKFKKFILVSFGIDSNKNKEVESDDIIIYPENE